MIIDLDASLIGHRRQTHTPSALELPEILSNVARYVPLCHLPACARISKSWYQACIPFIWEDVSLNNPRLLGAIKSHNHFVKTLTISSLWPENAGLRFPNLMSLSVYYVEAEEHAKFILNHSDITTLRLDQFRPDLEFALWSTLLGFRHLRKLMLAGLTMDKKVTDVFWQICTLIESGEFQDVYVADLSGLLCMEFPRMKELDILYFGGRNDAVSLPLEFARRCPRLELCHWEDSKVLAQPSQRAYMEELDNKGPTLRDPWRHAANHLSYMECNPDVFTPSSMALLRPHFSNLRVLVLQGHDHRVVCPMAQEILSSCPLLEKFSSTWIDGNLVANGKPWVCLRLKELGLGFVFNPSTLPVVQPMVFDQLSKLTRLEFWRLWIHYEADLPEDVVKLKLEYALDKLRTLRALRILHVGYSEQEIEYQEINWMLEHWKSLWHIHGRLCSVIHRERTMITRLQGYGMVLGH